MRCLQTAALVLFAHLVAADRSIVKLKVLSLNAAVGEVPHVARRRPISDVRPPPRAQKWADLRDARSDLRRSFRSWQPANSVDDLIDACAARADTLNWIEQTCYDQRSRSFYRLSAFNLKKLRARRDSLNGTSRLVARDTFGKKEPDFDTKNTRLGTIEAPIQVESRESNVTVTRLINITSGRSLVDIRESYVQVHVDANRSDVHIDPPDSHINISVVGVFASVNTSQNLAAQIAADRSEIYVKTNKSDKTAFVRMQSPGRSLISARAGNATVDAYTRVGSNVSVTTTNQPGVEESITIQSIVDPATGQRDVQINGQNEKAKIEAHLAQAIGLVRVGKIFVDIDTDQNLINIFTGVYVVSLRSKLSKFQVTMTKDAVIVEGDNATFRISPSLSNISGSIQKSLMHIMPKNATVQLKSATDFPATGLPNEFVDAQIEIDSTRSTIELRPQSDPPKILVNVFNSSSLITTKTTTTDVSVRSDRSNIELISGRPYIFIETYNTTIEIQRDITSYLPQGITAPPSGVLSVDELADLALGRLEPLATMEPFYNFARDGSGHTTPGSVTPPEPIMRRTTARVANGTEEPCTTMTLGPPPSGQPVLPTSTTSTSPIGGQTASTSAPLAATTTKNESDFSSFQQFNMTLKPIEEPTTTEPKAPPVTTGAEEETTIGEQTTTRGGPEVTTVETQTTAAVNEATSEATVPPSGGVTTPPEESTNGTASAPPAETTTPSVEATTAETAVETTAESTTSSGAATTFATVNLRDTVLVLATIENVELPPMPNMTTPMSQADTFQNLVERSTTVAQESPERLQTLALRAPPGDHFLLSIRVKAKRGLDVSDRDLISAATIGLKRVYVEARRRQLGITSHPSDMSASSLTTRRSRKRGLRQVTQYEEFTTTNHTHEKFNGDVEVEITHIDRLSPDDVRLTFFVQSNSHYIEAMKAKETFAEVDTNELSALLTYPVVQRISTYLEEKIDDAVVLSAGASQPFVGMIVAITIVCAAVLTIAAVVAYCCFKKKKRERAKAQRGRFGSESPAESNSPLSPKHKTISPPASAVRARNVEIPLERSAGHYKSSVVSLPPLMPTRANRAAELANDRAQPGTPDPSDEISHEALFDYVPPARLPSRRVVVPVDSVPKPNAVQFLPPESGASNSRRLSPTTRQRQARDLIDAAFPSPNVEVKRILDFYAK